MHGSLVYRGLHRGEWLVRCDTRDGKEDLWAISPSADRAAWGRCEGRVWIELETAHALMDLSDRSETGIAGGAHFELGMERCSGTLATEPSRLAPMVSDGANRLDAKSSGATRIIFHANASARQVECTLLWLFGAHSTARIAAQAVTVRLPSHIDKLELVGDIVVHAGTLLRLEAETAITLMVGSKQLRVKQGGHLELVGLTIADSVGGTALLSEGEVKVWNCSFLRCQTGSNGVFRIGETLAPVGSDANPPVRGALITGGGGAIRMLWSKATLAVIGTRFSNNAARGQVASRGGALYAVGGKISLEATTLQDNRAEMATYTSRGGAASLTYVYFNIANCRFVRNTARHGVLGAGGALEFANARGQIELSVFEGNVATDTVGTSKGGGIAVASQSTVELSSCRFVRNQALNGGGGMGTYGGAVSMDRDANLSVAVTVFEGNFACGLESAGGAIHVYASSLELKAGVSFRSNNVSSVTNAQGGAISLQGGSATLVADQATRFIGNTVRTSCF